MTPTLTSEQAVQRDRPAGELDRVFRGGGGVSSAGRGVPDQDAWFRLFELPPFGHLTPMVMTA
jgi:hypothetical protein